MLSRSTFLLLAGLGFAGAGTAGAQSPMPRFSLEALGGGVVPTFDIADVAKTGPMFGAAVTYQLNRWALIGEFDYGFHKDKATSSVDIKTRHYMGKIGYLLTGPREVGWEALVNLGAGAVSFDVQGAASTKTYFAINAGAKIAYNVNRSLAVVFSPQGDIAFSKKSELSTTNAWVWPFSAGIRLRF
jgi:outer membrane protein with beta-barrel domain